MENNKSRDVIMAIAGGYLAYTGVQLIMGALEERQDHYILFILIGAFFVIFGGTVLFLRAKKLLQLPQVDQTDVPTPSEGNAEVSDEVAEVIKEQTVEVESDVKEVVPEEDDNKR